jgi:5-methylcytosine-specific restriction endonuclease McrA
MPYKDRTKKLLEDQRRNREYKERNRLYSIQQKTKRGGCEECLRPFDEEVSYEFHWAHINPIDKYLDVSKLVGRGHPLSKVIAEINKCRLLCAQCHNKETMDNKHYLVRPESRSADLNQHPDQQQLEL